ncbi:PAS domain-containing protein [Algoriphagus ratkowskyi]|uniref:PAS domain-containing protein n=1 Tax=Algoriphagus ratkowskyi TaxID=57028 RepID=A0A2W7RM01_9BACT|nr:hypothetical protein [Algoriphagus ratkowskyi]PZX61291.1 PAS domain-containing protein [Algoriphagus ratkowskyi]
MRLKDIVNRDLVNLSNCEQEPIHIPGSIQPHGFLIGLLQDSFIIDYCSANTEEYLGIPYVDLLGSVFNAIFGIKAQESLFEYISKNRMLSSSMLKIKLLQYDFLCTVHQSENIYILEFQPENFQVKLANEVYDSTSQFLSYMHSTNSLKELCNLVAEGTRGITGYDRVMIYRFDDN